MISALRRIENRGELPDSNSAVMELCVDNPREGFDNIFDTHPSVDARVAALVKFAGGHDPGPINPPLPQPESPPEDAAPPGGPWSSVSEPLQPQDMDQDDGQNRGPWDPRTPI